MDYETLVKLAKQAGERADRGDIFKENPPEMTPEEKEYYDELAMGVAGSVRPVRAVSALAEKSILKNTAVDAAKKKFNEAWEKGTLNEAKAAQNRLNNALAREEGVAAAEGVSMASKKAAVPGSTSAIEAKKELDTLWELGDLEGAKRAQQRLMRLQDAEASRFSRIKKALGR